MNENYTKLILDNDYKTYEDKVFGYFSQINKIFKFGKNVIDLGCGHGKYSVICRDWGYNVTGIDARKTRIPFNEKNINWIISDVCDLNVIKSDCVLFFGLLYHLNYEQQVGLIEKIDTNILIINTHFAVIKENKILNTTKPDKLHIVKKNQYEGVQYKEAESFDSLKNRPLASFSNLHSFWPTLDSLAKMLITFGNYSQIYVVEPYLTDDRTYIIATK